MGISCARNTRVRVFRESKRPVLPYLERMFHKHIPRVNSMRPLLPLLGSGDRQMRRDGCSPVFSVARDQQDAPVALRHQT